jgi:prepilin-type N-terminal cleavage/methylation domain-containing protein
MNKSFTLIEILIVIIVIGVLSAFILVGMSSISDKANIAKGQAFTNSLRNSLLMNLVAELKFDDGSGQIAIDSWKTNNATVGSSAGVDNNDPAWTTFGCVSGNCLLFDGSASGTFDYIYISDNDNLTFSNGTADTPFTFELWLKSNYESTTIDMISKSNEYNLTANYNLRMYVRDSSTGAYLQTSAGSIVRDNKWKHIVATYNGNASDSGIVFYVNTARISYPEGIFGGTYTRMRNSANNTYIGYLGLVSSTFYFDNFNIYNGVVPTSKIDQNYYIGINKLFNNSGITLEEFNQRIVELKNNLANN